MEHGSVIEFKVSCPKCKVDFFIPVELGGEMAECSECGSVFQIPIYTPDAGFETTELKKTTEEETGENSHSTVRLSRTSIGMMPTLKDEFEIGGKQIPPWD